MTTNSKEEKLNKNRFRPLKKAGFHQVIHSQDVTWVAPPIPNQVMGLMSENNCIRSGDYGVYTSMEHISKFGFILRNSRQFFKTEVLAEHIKLEMEAHPYFVCDSEKSFNWDLSIMTYKLALTNCLNNLCRRAPVIQFKGGHTFRDVNIMEWLEFELVQFEVAVEHFGRYATRTLNIICKTKPTFK